MESDSNIPQYIIERLHQAEQFMAAVVECELSREELLMLVQIHADRYNLKQLKKLLKDKEGGE